LYLRLDDHMKNMFIEISNCLEDGENIVVGQTIRRTGSTPREIGSKCIILEDGTTLGTIGGGLLEYRVVEKAKEIFKDGKSSILHFELTGENVAESDMLCGGKADIYLELLSPKNEEIKYYYKRIKDFILSHRRGMIISSILEGSLYGAGLYRALVAESGEYLCVAGDMGGKVKKQLEPVLKDRLPRLMSTGLENKGPFVFMEPIESQSTLYLFGAGHISKSVSSLANMAGFSVTVIDDREEFANKERFPDADEIMVLPVFDAFKRIDINDSSYIVVITRGHIHDIRVMQEALKKPPAYIGMIGSRRKRNLVYQALMKDGVSEERLKEVHSPIGLNLGAETPEEIAISIAAELIQVRVSVRGKKE